MVLGRIIPGCGGPPSRRPAAEAPPVRRCELALSRSDGLLDVLETVVAASKRLSWWRHDPDAALAMLVPYHDLEYSEAHNREQYDRVMSLVYAVTADCYLTKRQPQLAADWYSLAAEHHKHGGYPYLYADAVIRYNLTEHYATALACIEAASEQWRQHSMVVRLLCHLGSKWWLHPYQWRLQFTQHRFASILRSRLDHLGTS